MTGAWAILKKDLFCYYRSWMGVIAMFSFLVLAGIFFTFFLFAYSQLSLEAARQAYQGVEDLSASRFVLGAFLLNLGILFLFLAPLLSMRSLAEEKKFGTLELLYTYPLSDLQIVLGKYLALLAQLALLFLPTLTYLIVIRMLGARVDAGVVFTGSLGFFLLGASFLAIGLFFSSLTENQVLASGLTFVFLMGLWILEWLTSLGHQSWISRLGSFSPFVHFRDFHLGVVDFTDASYFLGVIIFFFFLTLRVIETRNWKG